MGASNLMSVTLIVTGTLFRLSQLLVGFSCLTLGRELICVWCVAFWEKFGKPKKILLVELGPGDGSLCIDLLNSFKNFKEFYSCLKINLLEKSHKLINKWV